MIKKSIILGLLAGILAALASVIYQKIYASSLGADFTGIVKTGSIVLASLAGGLLAAVGHYLLVRKFGHRGEIIFNFVLVIGSFASVLAPFALKLPLDVEMPELFPGLTVPMHFFPALAWFTLKPLFFPAHHAPALPDQRRVSAATVYAEKMP